jgi:hypothetical protein
VPPPTSGATEGGTQQPDPFADAGESKAFASRVLGRTVHLAIGGAEGITEDDTPRTEQDRQRIAETMAAARRALEATFRSRADEIRFGQPQRPADEQIAAVTPQLRPKPLFLTGAVLLAARRAAGIPAAAP